MASIKRAGSALLKRKRSATTSSTCTSVCAVAAGVLALALGLASSATGAARVSMRWPCTRVKPLAESHCVTSSALAVAGSSTAKLMTKRGSTGMAATRSRSVWAMESGESWRTGTAVWRSKSWAPRANKSFRWSLSSVMVPTVERELRTGLVWSMAMAGGTPSTRSTAGLSMRSKN